jgi:deoxycytidylate deaminase
MIHHAIKIAKRSSTGKYAMGCVIVDNANHKIISNGWAHVPNMKNYRLYSLHAELHALVRMRHTIMENGTAYIASLSRKSGNHTTARPCRDCALALFSAGVNVVVYTVPGSYGPLSEHACTEKIDLFYELDRIDSFKLYNSPQF